MATPNRPLQFGDGFLRGARFSTGFYFKDPVDIVPDYIWDRRMTVNQADTNVAKAVVIGRQEKGWTAKEIEKTSPKNKEKRL